MEIINVNKESDITALLVNNKYIHISMESLLRVFFNGGGNIDINKFHKK